jgi:hypothetical protein
MILIILLTIVFSTHILYAFPSVYLEDGRFYSHAFADLNGDGEKEIIGVGQKKAKKTQRGYIAAYELRDNQFSLLSEHKFSITHEGKELAGRIRSVMVMRDPDTEQWEVYVSGRGGEDETGVGFLKKCVYQAAERKFQDVHTHVFSSPNTEYTHGYPIALWKVHGETKPAVIYGGFSGDDKGDIADIRVFKTGNDSDFNKCFLKPFSNLQIPLRVNALCTGDIDGDGKEDILIAGRTKKGDMEVGALAYYSNGRVYHKIMDDRIPSRFRTMFIADLDRDQKAEVITGGRMDAGEHSLGRLELWGFDSGSFSLKSRYSWTCEGSTRLRTFALHPEGNFFSAGGRSQITVNDELVWEGFVRHFSIENNRIIPIQKIGYFNEGPETRIRNAEYLKSDILVISGFISLSEKKKKGFISLIPSPSK